VIKDIKPKKSAKNPFLIYLTIIFNGLKLIRPFSKNPVFADRKMSDSKNIGIR